MSPSVLVVDDNVDLAENVAEVLASEGFESVAVDSPGRAIEAVGRRSFDFVVLDVRMPGMDGIELHERLAPHLTHTRFVYMTAYATDDRLSAASRAGASAILSKPFPPRALLDALRAPGSKNGT